MMKKFSKIIAALAALAVVVMSFAGCSLVKDMDDVNAYRQQKEERAKSEAQMQETILKIADDITVSGAYYGWYFANAYNTAYAEAAQALEADSSADSSATPEVDVEAIKAQAKESIIATKMAYAKATEQGIELTDADYDAIDDQLDQLKASIAQQGISYTDYLYLMQTNAETVEQIVTEEYTGTLYYASLVKADYATAKHILVKYDDGVHTKEEASKLISDIKKELDGGADFDKLMNEKSEDGRNADGTLASPDGYTFTKGQMVPEFEAAAFALGEGKISDIVAVESEGYKGFHIVKKMPTSLSGIATAIMQGADAAANIVIEAERSSLTSDVKVEETDKIGYYEKQYK